LTEKFPGHPARHPLITKVWTTAWAWCFFPKGPAPWATKSSALQPALLEPGTRAGYPVSYAAISYRTPPDEPPAHAAVCWWGEMDFVPHFLKLLLVSKIEATVVYVKTRFRPTTANFWLEVCGSAVNEQFTPVVARPAAPNQYASGSDSHS